MDSFCFCCHCKNFLLTCVVVSPSSNKLCSNWNTTSGLFFSTSGCSYNSSLTAPSKWYRKKYPASFLDWELMARLAYSIQSSIRWSSLTPVNFWSLCSLGTLRVTCPGEDPDPLAADVGLLAPFSWASSAANFSVRVWSCLAVIILVVFPFPF